MQFAHDLDVQGLQRVTGGLDEENNGMDAVVHDVHAVDLILGFEIGVEPLLNVLDDWLPGFVIVDEVAKARGVDHGQS